MDARDPGRNVSWDATRARQNKKAGAEGRLEGLQLSSGVHFLRDLHELQEVLGQLSV